MKKYLSLKTLALRKQILYYYNKSTKNSHPKKWGNNLKMKKLYLTLVVFCFTANFIFAQSAELPRIAVYVASGGDVAEHRAFSTMMLEAFVNSGRYTAVERADAFIQQIDNEQARQRSGAVDDAQISRLGRQSGVDFICVVDIIPALGEFQLSARLIDVESARVTAMASTESRLENLASLRSASNELSGKLLGAEVSALTQIQTPTTIEETSAPIVDVDEPEIVIDIPTIQESIPTSVHTPTVETETEESREEKTIVHFFGLKWMPPITDYTQAGWGFNLEYGQVRDNRWWWSLDGGFSLESDDDRHDRGWMYYDENISVLLGGTFNIGAIRKFNNGHIAYGGSVGFWYGLLEEPPKLTHNERYMWADWGIVGPIVRLRYQFIEVTYRGLIGIHDEYDGEHNYGIGYLNQLMIGFHFGTNNRRRQ